MFNNCDNKNVLCHLNKQIFKTLAIAGKKQEGARTNEATLWLAPIQQPPRYRLTSYRFEAGGRVQLVEKYHHIISALPYYRVYLSPTVTEVPSYVIGEIEVIQNYADRDRAKLNKLPLGPTNIEGEALSDTSLLEIIRIPDLAEFAAQGTQIYYYYRPCSFVLTRTKAITLSNKNTLKAKLYINQIHEKSGFLVYYTLGDESQFWPDLRSYGVALTNYEPYTTNRPWGWSSINVQL